MFVKLVAIDTLDQDGLAVHQQLGVLDLYAAESKADGCALGEAFGCIGRNLQLIQIWGLGAPEAGIRNRTFALCHPATARLDAAGSHLTLFCINYYVLDLFDASGR